jgi:hypothetical protein
VNSRDFWLTVLAVIVAQLAGGAIAYLATNKLRGGKLSAAGAA